MRTYAQKALHTRVYPTHITSYHIISHYMHICTPYHITSHHITLHAHMHPTCRRLVHGVEHGKMYPTFSSHVTHTIRPNQPHRITYTHAEHHTRSAQIAPKSTIFLKKTIHFALHTRVHLQGRFCESAKSPTILDGSFCIFEKKYAFCCSVVTSMCVPTTQNHYFFKKSSDLPSKMLTFQLDHARSAQTF